MAKATRFILPFADVGAGITPSDGSQLFFSDTGLSFAASPRNTFSDQAATTPNANPVIADSKGVFSDIFIVGTYNVVLKDKNGVQIWAADPVLQNLTVGQDDSVFETVTAMVASADLSVGDHARTLGYLAIGDGGGNDYDIVASGTGTVDGGRFINLATHQAKGLFTAGPINVKLFGAAWNDSADDSPQVQFWVDYLGVNNCSGEYPPGTGRFSGIEIDVSYHGLSLRGAARGRGGNAGGVTHLKNNGTTPMFSAVSIGTLPMLIMSDFRYSQVSATGGEMFVSTHSIDEAIFERIEFALLNTAKSWIDISPTGHPFVNGVTDLKLSKIFGTPAVSFSVSPIFLKSDNPGNYFNNVFEDSFFNGNNTATAPMIRLRDSSGGVTNGTCRFRNLVFELPAHGGAIHCSSIRNSIFENIFCADSSGAATHHIIHLDADVTPGSQNSAFNSFTACISIEGDSNFKDLHVESTGAGSNTVVTVCAFGHVDIQGAPYTDINNAIGTDHSLLPPFKLVSGNLFIPPAAKVTYNAALITGTDDTSSAADFLTDSTAPFKASALVGLAVKNDTDGSHTIVTANTTSTVTGILTGGTTNKWNSGDSYSIQPIIVIPEIQTGRTGVLASGANEVVVFDTKFSNTPTVTLGIVGATDKAGGSAQQSGSSTTGVTIYNFTANSTQIDWTAIGAR